MTTRILWLGLVCAIQFVSTTTQVNAAPNESLALTYSGEFTWDGRNGVVTFRSSGNMPDDKESFFWKVPDSVKRIVIKSDVTVNGAIRVMYRKPSNPLHIVGEDRDTSVLFGTDQQNWTDRNKIAESDKWEYGAISVIQDAVVHVSNLTSKNPRGYNISGYANEAVIHVEKCNLIDNRGGDNNNSDGFLGAAGSSIRDSFISTSDDGIKIYHDITIENVTIEQHRNGAPLQFGWFDENDTATATIKNLTIKGVASDDNYNMAPLTWENGQRGTRHVNIDGLNIDLKGQMYDEANDKWHPIGLLELKPTGCMFNLTVEKANLRELSPGIRETSGTVKVDGKILP